MGIFDALKSAIFGAQPQARPGPTTSAPSQAPPGAAAVAGPAAAAAVPPAAKQGAAPPSVSPPESRVDIDAALGELAAKKSERLNWQSSIVDLMKLVDLDPSLENRKELAGELGYTGDTRDSAKMNVWLHHEVMRKLAAAGGKVPESLRH